MARVAVQFVANSNMGAVTKDIARINAQLAALAASMAKIGSTPAGAAQVKSLGDTFRSQIANIKGYESATMSARTVTNQLTEDINRQKIQMKDMASVRKNLNQLAQEQMRLRNSSAMITSRDLASGRAIGDLIVPTQRYAKSLEMARLEAGILGKAMESAGQQGVAAGKRMMWTGRQLTTGITAPIVAVAAVSAKAAYDIDAAMVRLTKVYGDLGGASEEELSTVRAETMKTAKVVAREYGIAGKATVTLAADLAAAGYEGEALQKTTREIQRIALLGELDQQKAMDATRTIQTVFGISTMDLADKFNFLNAVENQTNATLQDLTEVIPRAAGVVREMGGTLEDTAVFTVAFKEAGIDAVIGANALRSSLGAIAAPSKVAQKRLSDLGIDIRRIAKENHPDNGGRGLVAMLQELGSELEGLGSLEKTEALSVLFGRYQFNKMGGLLKGLSENANDAGTQVGRAFQLTAASTEQLADVAEREIEQIQSSLSGRLRRAGADIVLTFAEIGRPVLSVIVDIVEAFGSVLNVINGFPKIIKTTVGVFLGLLALAGPIMFFRGVFKALFNTMFQFVGKTIAARKGVTDLQTAQSTFAQHAANSVIPTIAAEAGAAQKLGAQMAFAAGEVAKLAAAQKLLMTGGLAAGTAAGARPASPTIITGATSHRRAERSAGPPTTGRPAPSAINSIVPIGAPGQVVAQASAGTAAANERTAAASAKTAKNWAGAAQSMAFIAPLMVMMSGTTNRGLIIGSQLLLVLALIPGAFKKIGDAAKWVAVQFKLMGAAGATSTTAIQRGAIAARAAVASIAAPLMAVAAAIGIAVGIYRLWQRSIDETKKKQKQLNEAAMSMSEVIGFNYVKAGQTEIIDPATGEKILSLAEKTEVWAKANKNVVKSLRDMDDARLKDEALRIGVDARRSGASAEQAMEAVKIALRAARGDLAKDLLLDIKVNFDNDASVENLKKQLDMKRINDILNNKFEQGNWEGFGRLFNGKRMMSDLNEGAKVAAQGLGTTFAKELDNTNKQEVKAAFDRMQALINQQLLEKFGAVKELSEQQRNDLRKAAVNPDDDAAIINYLKQFAGHSAIKNAAGDNVFLARSLRELSGEYRSAQTFEKEFVDGLLAARGVYGDNAVGVDTLGKSMNTLGFNVISISEAQKQYENRVTDGMLANKGFTEEMHLAILNTYRMKAGQEAATSVAQGFGDAIEDTTGQVEKLSSAAQFGASVNADFASKLRSGLAANISEGIALQMGKFDEVTEAQRDAVKEQNRIWEDGLSARRKASDKAFDNRGKVQDATFEAREKIMDQQHDRVLENAKKEKDARIKAIQAEMDKADELDQKRKKMFEAEITRLQRLQAAANVNIDFNVALKSGNLDEAARIQEAAYVTETTNQMNDAGSLGDDAAARRRAAGEARIAKVTSVEDIRIAKVQELIEKEKEEFKGQRERAKAALDDAKQKANERFDAEKLSYQKSAEVAAKAQEKIRAELRRTTEASLKEMAIEIPRKKEGYQGLMTNIGAKFTELTGIAAAQTAQWNDLHARGFEKVMWNTHREIRNETEWAKTGKYTVDTMTQAMLGMSFDEFATWMQTGNRPTTKPAPAPTSVPGSNQRVATGTRGGVTMNHGGGPVGQGSGRAGRPMDAPLYPDEVPTVLQRGEFVVQKSAVDKLGAGTLAAINSGQASFYHGGGLVGAVGAGIMMNFKEAARLAIETGAKRKVEELRTSGESEENIPEALRYLTEAAKAGRYGDSNLDNIQLQNAATILGVGRSMGVSERDLKIALMTALQESSLRNLPGGDRDSLGLFQQRPSQGWGSAGQIMDPKYAARKFFEGLMKVESRNSMSLTEAAQAVQRSGHPGAYARWEDEAAAILNATATGGAFGGLTAAQYQGGGTFRLGKGVVTGDIQGLNLEFLKRLARWAEAVGQPYRVGSGYRSMAEQAILYNRYRAGVPGQAPAAPPGQSNHNFGLASDGPHWGGKNPGAFGLRYPMSYEPWHVEPIGARTMRVPQLKVGGTVNYDDTIANLHKNETVLTAPLSKKLEQGINSLDSGGDTHYTINVYGGGADADTVANKVLQKIQRREQIRGPKRVIN